MRIFLTGATGYIGSAVLDASLRAGHQVTALVRDPEKGERVARRGVHPVLGDLSKPNYVTAAEACDVIIHTALDSTRHGPEKDRQTIETLIGAALRRADTGNRACLIYTSGIWIIGETARPAEEDTALNPVAYAAWRAPHEEQVLAAGADGRVRTVVVRPGIVYGGARGIIGDLVKDAANGLVRIIGNGKNHWPCVYDRDLADLYVKLASNGSASGVFHANDQADERVIDIVEAIAAHVKRRPEIRYVPLVEARAKMGDYAEALALDQKLRSPRAHAIGWAPTLHSVSGNVARLFEEFRTAREAAWMRAG
jgi:nucleoside-diphosphate-sugar epimerase